MRRSFFKRLVILGVCLGSIFLFHCSEGRKTSSPTLAPDFTLKTLEDEKITLSELKGKTVLLDFWATWCGPCRESIPHLIQIHKTYQKNGLELIGMDMDRGDMDTVRRFVKSMEIPYPILITPDDVARQFGVTGLPTTIFIDKKGKVRGKIVGFNSAIAKQIADQAATLTSENP